MSDSLKVLVSAYACEPEKGSEPAAGWNWVKQTSRFNEVWVITRANNRPAIDRSLAAQPMPNVHWVYFDLPWWLRIWKRGQRGIRLYYYLWQSSVYFIGRRLHRKIGFHLINHVTLGNCWMPSFLAFLPVPFIWGPVGGGESSPKTLLETYGVKGKAYEYLRGAARYLGERDPSIRLMARRTKLTFATTSATAERLKKLGFPGVSIFPQSGLSHEEIATLAALPLRYGNPFRLASIGRLLHWKGFHLGLEAFARLCQEFPESEYYLVGTGPERRKLENLANKLGISPHVRFWENLSRQQAMDKLVQCDALVHPSLHDSSPWICLEAMAAGRPVICLDWGGPTLQVTHETGCKVVVVSPEQVIKDLTGAMSRLAHDPALRRAMGEAGRQRVAECFSWDKKGELIQEIYQEVLGRCP